MYYIQFMILILTFNIRSFLLFFLSSYNKNVFGVLALDKELPKLTFYCFHQLDDFKILTYYVCNFVVHTTISMYIPQPCYPEFLTILLIISQKGFGFWIPVILLLSLVITITIIFMRSYTLFNKNND